MATLRNKNEDKDWYYSIQSYENQEELLENSETLKLVIEEYETSGRVDPEELLRLKQTQMIYDRLLEDYIDYSELYQAEFPSYINDSFVYFDSISDIIFPFVLVFFIIAFYVSFSMEFDDKTFVYIYDDKNREKQLFKKIGATLLATLAFLAFCLVLVGIYSLAYTSEIKQVLVVGTNSIDVVSKPVYLLLYTFGFSLLKLSMIVFLTIGVSLFARKGIIVLISMFGILLLMIILSLFAQKYSFILGMGRSFNDYSFSAIYILLISFSIVVVSFAFSFWGFLKFKKRDLM